MATRLNSDIQILRAIAILITLIAHLPAINPAWISWTGYFWLGGGVDLFFSISGFLIVGQLLKLAGECKSFMELARTFWLRRIFRLWPSALAWSVIAAALALLSGKFTSEFRLSWLFASLNVENIYISACATSQPPCGETTLWTYWSLSLEEQFYLIIPFLIYFVRNRAILASALLAAALFQFFAYRPWGSLLWFTRSDALIYGALIAIAVSQYGAQIRSFFSQVSITMRRYCLAVLLLGLIVLSRQQITPFYMGFVAFCSGLIVAVCSFDQKVFGENLLSSVALWVGSRSYSIYLIHFPIFYVARPIFEGAGSIATLIAGITTTLIVADLSFRCIETPFRKIGRDLTEGYSVKPATLAA